MKKLIALLVAAAIIGFPASTWHFSRQAQAQSAQLGSKLTAVFPYVTVVSNDYQKGFFKSTQTLKLRPAFPGFDAKTEHEFSLVNVIEHGPLPGFKGIGAARVTHSLLLPAALQKALATVYGEQSPVTAVTQFNIGGGGATTLSSPKISGQTAEGKFSFQGLDGVVKFAAGLKSFDYNMSAPGLEFSDNKNGKLNLGAMAMAGTQTKVAGTEHIYVGKQDSSMATMSVINAGKPAFSMQGLRYVVESSNAEKDFMSGSGKLNGKSLKAGELDLGALDYEFSMQKLHVPSLDALTKSIQASVAKATEASAAKPNAGNAMQSAMGVNSDMLAAFKQHLPELSKHQPSFTLDKFRIGTEKDFALTNATLRLLPVAATDLDNPMSLIPKLDASLNIELSDSFLTLLAGTAASRMGGAPDTASTAQLPPELRASAEALQAQQALQAKQMVDAQLEGAIAQGYLIRGVGKVSAQLTLKGGQLLVNGRPMGPNLGQMK